MNPRILKKVCKKIVEMGHPIAKDAWFDDLDSIGCTYIGNHLWRDRRDGATAKQWRSHYMTQTSISNIYVVGGGLDYWGEAEDPRSVYSIAWEHIMWSYGTPRVHFMTDDAGEVIDEVQGWPDFKGNLTAMKVIQLLKSELAVRESDNA